MKEHDIRVSARTAALRASDGDDEDGPPWRFSGIAVAAGDILHMDDGTPVLFTDEELRKAAETQQGEPLTADHPRDEDGRPQYPPPTDETIGKVQKAGWLDSQEAVGYDASTHDEQIADGVQAGSFEVSVHPSFSLGDKDPETGAYVAKDIQFKDLSVVSKGDSPSNTAQWGPNQALASYTQSTDIGAELTAAGADVDDDLDADTQGVIQSTVAGMFEALGFSPDPGDELAAQGGLGAEGGYGFVPNSAEADDGDTPNEPAEPGADDSTTNMDDSTREQYVRFLTANAGFDEESVSEMDDDVLEQTYELAAEGAGDGAGDGSTDDDDDDDDDDPQTLDEMTVPELGEALREEGFVTEDSIGDVADQVTAQASKSEKVDEIIANSSDYEEDDREELMSSADSLVEREHERVTDSGGSQLPASAGASGTELTAGALSTDDGDDLDEYGTGVAED